MEGILGDLSFPDVTAEAGALLAEPLVSGTLVALIGIAIAFRIFRRVKGAAR